MRDLDWWTRQAAVRACWWRPFRHWQVWTAFFTQFPCVFVGVMLGGFFSGFYVVILDRWLGFTVSQEQRMLAVDFFVAHPYWTMGLFHVGVVLGALLGSLAFTQMYSKYIRPYLRQYLARTPAPTL